MNELNSRKGGQTPPALILRSGGSYDWAEAYNIGGVVFLYDNTMESVTTLIENSFKERFDVKEQIDTTDLIELKHSYNFWPGVEYRIRTESQFPAHNTGSEKSCFSFYVEVINSYGNYVGPILSIEDCATTTLEATYTIDQHIIPGQDGRARLQGSLTLKINATSASPSFNKDLIGNAVVYGKLEVTQNQGIGGASTTLFDLAHNDPVEYSGSRAYGVERNKINDDYNQCQGGSLVQKPWCRDARNEALERLRASTLYAAPFQQWDQWLDNRYYSEFYHTGSFDEDQLTAVNPTTGLSIGFSSNMHLSITDGSILDGGYSIDRNLDWGRAYFEPETGQIYFLGTYRQRYLDVCPYQAFSDADISCKRLPFAEDDLSGALQAVYRGIRLK